MGKTKISLYVLEEVWRAFRVKCVGEKKSASQEVERLMKEELEKKQNILEGK